MNSPRIVFMGTPDFAVASLEVILTNGMNVVAVVTTPDKPQGRGLVTRESAVKSFATKHNLTVLEPPALKDESFISELKKFDADIFVVVAFKILPRELLTIPKLGAFNLHASLLPKYRGAAPINRAIMNGEHETGVTTFFLREQMDTGSIILQEKIPITDSDDAGTLHAKLATLGAQAVVKTLAMISAGNVETHNQDDSFATLAPKIFRDDCHINWNESAEKVRNFIRGLSPYPGAFTTLDNKEIKIFQTEIASGKKIAPGEYVAEQTSLYFGTATDALKILLLQPEGKRRMSAEEFLRGKKNI